MMTIMYTKILKTLPNLDIFLVREDGLLLTWLGIMDEFINEKNEELR